MNDLLALVVPWLQLLHEPQHERGPARICPCEVFCFFLCLLQVIFHNSEVDPEAVEEVFEQEVLIYLEYQDSSMSYIDDDTLRELV